MNLQLRFSEVECEHCGNRAPFSNTQRCQSCESLFSEDEWGPVDPAVLQRRAKWGPLAARLTSEPSIEPITPDDPHAWLQEFLAAAREFIRVIDEIADLVTADSRDIERTLDLADQAVTISRSALVANLPTSWRLVHSLCRGISRSLTSILKSMGEALEVPLYVDATSMQSAIQNDLDRAGALLGNFDLAMAGLRAASGAPMGEIVAELAEETFETASQRIGEFVRYYFNLDDEEVLSPDLAWGLAGGAFFIETRNSPDEIQKRAIRLSRRMSADRSWRLPDNLLSDLQLSGERIEAARQVVEALSAVKVRVLREEEHARMVGRLAEEALRPMLVLMTYLLEGQDDPTRYQFLRTQTLASIAEALRPRLPTDERHLSEPPIDYRHAYAHGGVGNDGQRVTLDLIEPARRLHVSGEEIEHELELLADRFATLIPALVIAASRVFHLDNVTTMLPGRLLAQQIELLFAMAGLESIADIDGEELRVSVNALPASPSRLLQIAVGLRTIRAAGTLVVQADGGPEFRIPLGQLPPTPFTSMGTLESRYHLYRSWSDPQLADARDLGQCLENDLVVPVVRVLIGLAFNVREAQDADRPQVLRTLTEEADLTEALMRQFRASTQYANRVATLARELAGDCRRIQQRVDRGEWDPALLPAPTGIPQVAVDLEEAGRRPTPIGIDLRVPDIQ